MRTPLTLAATALLAVSFAGCGGDDGDDTKTSSSTPAAATAPAETTATAPEDTMTEHPDGHELTIKMAEFSFDPKDAVASAGEVTITGPNVGNVVHELVLLKTDADPAKLPMKGSEVDESTSVGEIPDVEPGATKKVTLDLKPGKYAMICALPGHYQSGMYGSLTVK